MTQFCRVHRNAGTAPISIRAMPRRAHNGNAASRPTPGSKPRRLLATIEDHELVDPALSSERLLYRLFHEQGVTVFPAQDVRDACRCRMSGIEAMLRRFTPLERRDMTGDDGLIA